MLFQRCVRCRWNCSLQIRTHDTILQRKINTKHDCVTHTATSTGKQSRRPSLRVLLTYTCETGWQSNERLPIYGRRMTTDSAFQLNKGQWITESRSWKNVRLFDAVFQVWMPWAFKLPDVVCPDLSEPSLWNGHPSSPSANPFHLWTQEPLAPSWRPTLCRL